MASMCQIDGCDKPATSRGHCGKHYMRLKRTGSTAGRPRVNTTCSVCGEPAKARGYCGKHYQRYAKYGDPTMTTKKRRTCSLCDLPVHGNGLCQKHYRRMVVYGDPNYTKPRKPKPERRCTCGATLEQGRTKCDDCRLPEYVHLTGTETTVECRECGLNQVTYIRKMGPPPVCSQCQARREAKNRQAKLDRARAGRIVRRARERNADIEDVRLTWRSLFDEGETICWLCNTAVDARDYKMVDGSDGRKAFVAGVRFPTLDHIVPLARGGSHARENLKIAHHSCNSSKGIRLIVA